MWARKPSSIWAARDPAVLPVSALTGEGMEALLAAISDAFSAAVTEARLQLSHDDGRRRAWLYEQGVVVREEQGENGPVLDVRWSERQRQRYDRL